MISLRVAIRRMLLKLPLSRRWRLNVQESLINLLYNQDEKAAEKNGEDRGRIEGARIFELGQLEEEREVLLTNELVAEARRLRIPVQRPQFTVVDNRMAVR